MGMSWRGPFLRETLFLFPLTTLAISQGVSPVSSPPPITASSVTTGRPSPAFAVSSLNKLRQLSYLLPHLSLGSCGGVGVVVRGAQAKPQRGGSQAGRLRLALLHLTASHTWPSSSGICWV